MKRTLSTLAFSGFLVFGLATAISSAQASALAAGGTAANVVKMVDRTAQENVVEANHRDRHRYHRGKHRYHRGKPHRRHHGRRHWHDDRPRSGFFLEFGTGGYRHGPSYVRPRYVQPHYVVPRAARGLPSAHVNWCHARYRSYRAYDNSFQPYHGPRRACISPYWR